MNRHVRGDPSNSLALTSTQSQYSARASVGAAEAWCMIIIYNALYDGDQTRHGAGGARARTRAARRCARALPTRRLCSHCPAPAPLPQTRVGCPRTAVCVARHADAERLLAVDVRVGVGPYRRRVTRVQACTSDPCRCARARQRRARERSWRPDVLRVAAAAAGQSR